MRWRLLLLLPLLWGVAWADVVHLRNGARIQGELIDEDSHQVVVRTAQGKITIPRRKVRRIERESKAALLLAQGKSLIGTDREKARVLLGRAARAGDPAVAKLARAELRRLEEADALPPSEAAPSSLRPGQDPFAEVEREAIVAQLEEKIAGGATNLRGRLVGLLFARGTRRHKEGEHRLAVGDFRRAAALSGEANRLAIQSHEHRCRLEVGHAAVRARDGRLATLAAEPVTRSPQPRARASGLYLLGRGKELLALRKEARESYQAALGQLVLPPNRDLRTFRELARLSAAGIPVDEHSPGVQEGWRWEHSQHFAVLHRLARGADVARELETLRAAVVERLGLRGRLTEHDRVAVFLFDDDGSYRQSNGAQAWSAGHAARVRAGSELIRVIYLRVGDYQRTARHEIAHILLGDVLDDATIPAWVAEGAAIYAEAPESRLSWLNRGRALAAQQGLRDLAAASNDMLAPGSSMSRDGVLRFYVQAGLMFRALATRLGVKRSLEVALEINRSGAQAALRGAGLDVDDFARLIEAVLREGQ